MIYDKGTTVRCRAEFRDTSDALQDPTTVSVTIRTPGDVNTTYVYGTDGEVVKSATGMYYIDVDANAHGRWYYRWFSTGTGQAAKEKEFTVSDPEAE